MMRWWVERGERRLEVAVRQVGERYEVAVDGTLYAVDLVPVAGGLAAMLCADGRTFAVAHRREGQGKWRISLGDRDFQVQLRDPLERQVTGHGAGAEGPQEIRAPIPGKVVSVNVEAGQEVKAGQPVVVLEAMKMQNQICCETSGRVESVQVAAGATVEGGQVLVVVR
jgi:glutaconyl-CoA/methylmalonyl-CoA decarboxylase subunit gamma